MPTPPGSDAVARAYAVLGVPPTATPSEVTGAYRRLVRTQHPDTGPAASGTTPLADVLAAYRTIRAARERSATASPRPEPGPPASPETGVAAHRYLRAGPVHRGDPPRPADIRPLPPRRLA